MKAFLRMLLFSLLTASSSALIGEDHSSAVLIERNLVKDAVHEIQKKGSKVLFFELGGKGLRGISLGMNPFRLLDNNWFVGEIDLENILKQQYKKAIRNPLNDQIVVKGNFRGSLEDFVKTHDLWSHGVACFINWQGVSNTWEWKDIKHKELVLSKGTYTLQDVWLSFADAIDCKKVRMFCSVGHGQRTTYKGGESKTIEYVDTVASISVSMYKDQIAE